MRQPHLLKTVAILNERSLSTLHRAITLSEGHFALILVRCNYEVCKEQMWQQLVTCTRVHVSKLVLPRSIKSLYTPIAAALAREQTSALIVFGLESVKAIDQVLIATNQVRDEFRKSFALPLVLWVTDEVLQKLTRFAPDFKSWAATSIKFELTTEQLLDLWQQTTDELFTTLLNGDLSAFIPNEALNLAPTCRRRQELGSALRDLEYRGLSLDPVQWATWQFILGRDAFSQDQLDVAFEHYQQSFDCWQQLLHRGRVREEESGGDSLPRVGNEGQNGSHSLCWDLSEFKDGAQNFSQSLERMGIILHHIGLCYCRQAQLQRLICRTKWEQAQAVFSKAIEVFAAVGRSELAAQLTIELGEVLKQLESWAELQALALHTLEELQTQNNPLRLAQAYGFLGAVALAQSDWEDAKYLALAALDLLAVSPSPQPLHQGWYLLFAAKAQRQLGELSDAIANLETAISVENLLPHSQKHPQLYIYISEELRSLHFEQRHYLRAFELKQQQRSLEQQYGFSTFLGAAPLQPFSRQGRGISSLEIAAAGRQLDVDRLIERLSRNDHKLTIIHGSSGVGKSSLINAGLVPALESRIIGAREAMQILQKAYRDWSTELERRLDEALVERQIAQPNHSEEELQHNCEPKMPQFVSNESATPSVYADAPNIASPSPNPPEAATSEESTNASLSPSLQIALSIAQSAMANSADVPSPLVSPKARLPNPSLSPTPTQPPIPSFQPLIHNPKLQKILKRLRQAAERKLLTVLIFDQFEEFFFACTNLEQRCEFYEFLAQCLNLPFLKVILSLREDYLHYLLECERYCNLGTINSNILDRQLRYHLGALSPDDARNVIGMLAAVSQFQLEDSLIAALVRDLAGSAGAVHPIELQVVGQQLQAEKITTLEQYYALGTEPKATLVERSLLGVINDCGHENEDTAWQVLFSLTEERGTRPLKTLPELLLGTGVTPQCFTDQCPISCETLDESLPTSKLDLILKILVGSGLVFRVPEEQQDRYQLVHDYLVEPIRQKYKQRTQSNIITQLAENEKTLARVRKQRLRAIAVGVAMTVLAIAVGGLGWRAEVQRRRASALSLNAQLSALSASSEALFVSNKKLDALLEGLRAARQLKTLQTMGIPVEPDTQLQAIAALSQAVYETSERNRLEGHGDVVWRAIFSPDGQLIASASKDGTVKLWHPDGTLVTTLNGHRDSVTSVSFSPDGQMLASSSWDGTIKLWRRDGKILKTLRGHVGQVYSVSFSPKGRVIVSSGGDGTIRLWTVSGQLVKTWQSHADVVRWVSFSPDGEAIASASQDRTIKLWTLQGKLLQIFKSHNGNVNCVVFSPNGQFLASASDDKTVKLWNRNGQLLKTFPKHNGWVMEVAFSADGQQLASASADNTVRLWNRDGTLLQVFTGHSDSVTGVSFSPLGRGGRGRETFSSNPAIEHKTSPTSAMGVTAQSPPVLLLASASNDKTIRLWGLGYQSRPILPDHGAVREVVFSPNNQLIATAGDDTTVKIWNRNGKLLHTLTGHSDRIDSLSFSPDGQLLASASRDGTIKLWTPSGTLVKTLNQHGDWVLSVSFSPDGERLATSSRDGTVKLWTASGTLMKTLTEHRGFRPYPEPLGKKPTFDERENSAARVNAVTFSPDGQLLASASDDKTVKLWTADGKFIRTLRGHSNWVLDVSFSPDSQILASASYDNTVKLWSRTGEAIKTLRGHTDSVARVRFSPSGQILATTSWDNRVQLWRLDDTLIKTLEGHKERVTSVNWSNDGKALASASRDSTVMVWNLDLDDLLDKSCYWLRYYLQNNPRVRQSDRQLCQAQTAKTNSQ